VTRVLVLTAVDVEARGLARHLGLAPVPRSPWARFGGGALEVACVGVRASELRPRTMQLERVDLVVSAGVCGALAPELSVGELVVPEVVVDAAGVRRSTASLRTVPRRGTLLSVDAVVETAADKARLWLEHGAVAVDMESALILAWASERSVPAAVIRGVSDRAEHGVARVVSRTVRADGRVSPLRAVTAALSRPTALPELMRLRTGTDAALRSVAAALARVAREG
jgi:adenosylhomocysteine nucleosidase